MSVGVFVGGGGGGAGFINYLDMGCIVTPLGSSLLTCNQMFDAGLKPMTSVVGVLSLR